MKIENNQSYELLKQGISAAVKRSNVISNNIANANTPGYKKFEVTFEENIRRNNEHMKRTDGRHFDINGKNNSDAGIEVVRVEDGSMRTDGNNVDVDNEMVNLAANTLKYNAMVSEINKVFRLNKMVIKGGE